MNKIYLLLKGGLGNQLFQYAMAKELSLKHEMDIVIDKTYLETRRKKETARCYELDAYNIKARMPTNDERDDLNKAKKKLNRLIYFNSQIKIINEKNYSSFNLTKMRNNSILLDGYWQDFRFFENCRDVLYHELVPKLQLTSESKKILNLILNNIDRSVSVHIRRGDYVSLKSAAVRHGTCSDTYYQQSMELIEEKINNPHYFIFSDDIDWVEKNMFFNSDHTFVKSSASAWEDLRLMSFCKHHILANSTFSFWGGWLSRANNYRDQVIILPKKWFNNSNKRMLIWQKSHYL